MVPLIRALNNTNFRVLVWTKDSKYTKSCGLKDVTYQGRVKSGNLDDEEVTFYIYYKREEQSLKYEKY